MKRMLMNKMKVCGIATAILFVVQGCMKDNLGDCGLSIRIRYTRNKAAADLLGERVDHLTLYIFDSNRTFVGAYPSQGALYNGYTVPLLLKAGTYDFVVWGNLGADYGVPSLVAGETQIQGLDLQFNKIGPQSQVVGFPDSLYYGASTRVNVRPTLMEDQVYTVDLIKNTKKITVIASGLPLSGPESEGRQFECNIFSQNAALRFIDNGISGNTVLTYIPHAHVDEQENVISEFVVIREIEDESTNSRLVYTMTGPTGTRTLLDRSLVTMLRAYLTRMSPYDFDVEDEFVIEVRFDVGNYMTASIVINGWEYYRMDVEV
jgi:hypothetical protein